MGSISAQDTATSEDEYISFLLTYAVKHGFSLALWRLPNNEEKHVIIAHKCDLLKHDHLIEELAPGFLFASFDKQKDRLYLSADYSFSFREKKLREPQTPLEQRSAAWLTDSYVPASSGEGFSYNKQVTYETTDKDNFVHLVKKGIAAIEEGKLEKIVPSRALSVELPDNFNVLKAFQSLCDAYPNALVSWVSTPEAGNWLGATPETLVHVEGGTIFKTVALAGTQAYEPGLNLKTVAWTQKEIEEQALVGRYIINCFKKIRLREYEEHGPKTVVAGNLMHLKTDFTVNMVETNFPQLGSTMLELLHPTSAVCGMPLESALHFLRENEGYERAFYAGYLGPVNFSNDICLFVNLRCLQLLKNKAICYAGAGVTADSVPDKEWHETEIKLNTMLNIIHPQRNQIT